MAEIVIWKTFKMMRKIMSKHNPLKMLKRILNDRNGCWEVKAPRKYRTELGKSSFTLRVRRLWEVLPGSLSKWILTGNKKIDFMMTVNKRWIF